MLQVSVLPGYKSHQVRVPMQSKSFILPSGTKKHDAAPARFVLGLILAKIASPLSI